MWSKDGTEVKQVSLLPDTANLVTVRDTPTKLLLPLKFSYHERSHAITCCQGFDYVLVCDAV